MNGTLGIIGAMAVEVDRLIGQMAHRTTTAASDMTFHQGTLGSHDTPVVVVSCGIGKVSAAMCAQALIDRFGVSAIINTGVAGALDPTLEIGDLVICSDAVQHDMDVSGLGFGLGVVPGVDRLAFEADAGMRATVAQAAAELTPALTPRAGRVASGDQFICEQADKERIVERFGACCCEMEGGAIAQVCWRNEVPFVIVRTISDKADGSSTTDYREFEQLAAARSVAVTLRTVELLG